MVQTLSLRGNAELNKMPQFTKHRWWIFAAWMAASLFLFWRPLTSLVNYALANDSASHILLIPFISAWLLIREQEQVFRRVSFDFVAAAFPLALAAFTIVWTLRSTTSWTQPDRVSGCALALVLLWISGFALAFGRHALKAGRFSLLFLFLAVPLPDSLLNYVIYFLQKGSAGIAELIFNLTGVPALRDGFVFHLAYVNIEVAKECSGIRSSMALLILALLVGHLLLRTFWKQAVFVISGMVIMLIKNGVRIATLTILAQYVDPGFLYGRLHRQGGVVFFVFGLLLLLPILWLLQRGENPPPTAVPRASAV
jgi:exosortase